MGGRRCVITGAQRYHDRMFCSSGFRECIDEGASDDKKQSQISEPATETLYASLVCMCAITAAQLTFMILYTKCITECNIYADRLACFIPCEEGQKQRWPL